MTPMLEPAPTRTGAWPSYAQSLVDEFESAETRAPLDAALQRALAVAYEAIGDTLSAAAARLAAEALEAHDALRLYNLATGYFMHGRLRAAEKWYRVALQIDSDLAVAHQNLAAILRERGLSHEADEHLHRAYSRQWLFVDAAVQPAATVLLTCAAGIGNVPCTTLLAPARYTTIKCMVEYVPREGIVELPPHDLIFNVIGDADSAAAGAAGLRALLETSGRPVMNAPERVRATRRDKLPRLLARLDGALVPDTLRFVPSTVRAEVLSDRLRRRPQILRPARSHGGQGVMLATQAEMLAQWLANARRDTPDQAFYATDFHDSRAADGCYRKYRIVFVGGRAFPYHLAISRHWMVHYFSADMLEGPDKLEEERRFLEDPQGVFGERAWQAVEEVGARMNLDYAGVDCTLMPDGSVLVFEANATMLVHPETEAGPLAHKNVHIEAILDAFAAHLAKRIQA